MKKSFLTVCIFLFITQAQASVSGDAQIERFDIWVRELNAILTSSADSLAVAKELVGSRGITFNLQALGRIYEQQDPKFKTEVKDSLKQLEDAIGSYEMWKGLDSAKAQRAENELISLLEKEGWSKDGKSPKLDEISNFIRSYSWLDYGSDRRAVLQTLRGQLDTLAVTNFDLTRLEKRDGDGKGLHELRREIRWFLIEAKVVNGLINYEPNQHCSVSEYASLLNGNIANHKYAIMNQSSLEVDPCRVEKCLMLGLVKSVNILGGLKDSAEVDNEARQADRVPQSLVTQATDLYREIKETRVFSRLSENIGRCER